MCSFPSLSSALEFVCDHQQVPAMKALIANVFVFVVIVIQPFLITCNSNCIEKKSHIVVDRRNYTRIFQFPLRINVKISEHAPNFNVFKPRLVCRRILILP